MHQVQYSKEQQSVSVEDRRRYNVDIHMPSKPLFSHSF